MLSYNREGFVHGNQQKMSIQPQSLARVSFAVICSLAMPAVSQQTLATIAKQIHCIGNSNLANLIIPKLVTNVKKIHG